MRAGGKRILWPRPRPCPYIPRMPSMTGFLRAWLRPRPGAVVADETTYARGDERLPATVFRPARIAGPLPAWIVLHGLTWSGRQHPSLVHFVSAIAAAGNVVYVPDIPEWRDLRIAPALTIATIRAAVQALQQRGDIEHEHAALFGFSFGATQALIAATDPGVRPLLHGIAAWGGYFDVRHLFRFGLTGEYDLDEHAGHIPPDPYALWIMAGNYLARTPGYEDARDVAEAVHSLAREAGRRRIPAWDASFDADKATLRERLPPVRRPLFDILAPATTAARPAASEIRGLGDAIAAAALAADPLLDPVPFLPRVRVPTLLAHGRDDHLIPWTETIRISRLMPDASIVDVVITGLFEHSGGTRRGVAVFARARETLRFLRLLRGVLRLPVHPA